MRLYVYKCTRCGALLERLSRLNDAPPVYEQPDTGAFEERLHERFSAAPTTVRTAELVPTVFEAFPSRVQRDEQDDA